MEVFGISFDQLGFYCKAIFKHTRIRVLRLFFFSKDLLLFFRSNEIKNYFNVKNSQKMCVRKLRFNNLQFNCDELNYYFTASNLFNNITHCFSAFIFYFGQQKQHYVGIGLYCKFYSYP